MPLFLDLIDQLQNLGLNRHIQGRGRLITDEDFGIPGQGDGDDNALTHAAGELEGILFNPLLRFRNAHVLHQGKGPFTGCFPVNPAFFQHFHDLLSHFHDGIQGRKRVLEDEADPVSPDLMHAGLIHFGQVHPVIQDFPAVQFRIAGQNAHDGLDGHGFAGTGFPHDGQCFPPVEIKAHAADRADGSAVRPERDAEIPDA